MPENHYLLNLLPRDRHNEIFEKVVRHINLNQKSIRKMKPCPFCNAKNLGVAQTCYKCGKRI